MLLRYQNPHRVLSRHLSLSIRTFLGTESPTKPYQISIFVIECYVMHGMVILISIHPCNSFQRRYEETKGPEWLWWFGTVGVVIFNACLTVWFALIPDPIPGGICAVSVLFYLLFFKFAKNDIKFLRDEAEFANDSVLPVINTTAHALSSSAPKSSPDK